MGRSRSGNLEPRSKAVFLSAISMLADVGPKIESTQQFLLHALGVARLICSSACCFFCCWQRTWKTRPAVCIYLGSTRQPVRGKLQHLVALGYLATKGTSTVSIVIHLCE